VDFVEAALADAKTAQEIKTARAAIPLSTGFRMHRIILTNFSLSRAGRICQICMNGGGHFIQVLVDSISFSYDLLSFRAK